MSGNTIGVITNPYAGKNKPVGDKASRLRKLVQDYGIVKETRNLDQLKTALAELNREQIKYLVCDGGDGTVHWAINSFAETMQKKQLKNFTENLPIIVPTNGGTIDFLAAKAQVIGGTETILAALVKKLAQKKEIKAISLPTFQLRGKQKGLKGDTADFTKIGFSAAIAGVGQRFFEKYYESTNPSAATIVEVIGKTFISHIVKGSPFAHIAPKSIKDYSNNIFSAHKARVVIDGETLPFKDYTTINVGSIAIDLKGVIKLFHKADHEQKLHCIAGSLNAIEVFQNIPSLHLGRDFIGKELVERSADRISVFSEEEKGLNPVIDGEMFEGILECHLEKGPKVRMISINSYAN